MLIDHEPIFNIRQSNLMSFLLDVLSVLNKFAGVLVALNHINHRVILFFWLVALDWIMQAICLNLRVRWSLFPFRSSFKARFRLQFRSASFFECPRKSYWIVVGSMSTSASCSSNNIVHSQQSNATGMVTFSSFFHLVFLLRRANLGVLASSLCTKSYLFCIDTSTYGPSWPGLRSP